MAYEVIDEDLKVEACEIGDLTLSQIESFLRLRGDGEKIETLTLFSRQDGTIVLNLDIGPVFAFSYTFLIMGEALFF